jgi:predicted metal-dependent hydrolase
MKTIALNNTEINRGVSLFNRAHFFDAHEVLEDVWNSVSRDRPSGRLLRQHVQGMVQVAVAFHHQSKGNYVGARSVLERAMRNLHGADSSFPGLDLDQLRAELEIWRRHLDHSERAGEKKGEKKFEARDVRRPDVLNGSAPALPKIKIKIRKRR